MSEPIRRWILAGPANALKAEIVMRSLVSNPVIQSRPFVFLCEKEYGCAVECARELGIEVLQTSDPRFKTEDSQKELGQVGADMLVCCGWDYIVPPSVFEGFSYPCLNCHSSLLPDYKGQRAYLHQWANCEKQYGVTIHFISEKLDEGKMLLQGALKLFPKENIEMMHRRMSEMTGVLLPQALLLVEAGVVGESYDRHNESRYFLKISPRRAKLHRFFNRGLSLFNLPRWTTPHKSA
jgi:phosphoribosylglycinamide formyltransferase 1